MSNDTTQQTSVKLCECGCGQPAPIAKRTKPELGHIKGFPTRFVRGHGTSMQHIATGSNPSGLCMCGCGQKTEIAPHSFARQGWVKGHPLQFVHGHNRRIQTPQEAFSRYFVPGAPDECWLWQGSTKSSHGYGIFVANNKKYQAHRFSYEIHHGPIPKGMFVCHRCDNPPCINPDHLFAGTQADNMQDASQKGRVAKGSLSSVAKLTESDVVEIRRLYHLGGISQFAIAQQFGVTRSCIAHIIQGNSWNHV